MRKGKIEGGVGRGGDSRDRYQHKGLCSVPQQQEHYYFMQVFIIDQ